jgi:hypothetical protein
MYAPAIDTGGASSTTHLIVLAHGIDGTVRDMHAVRDAILRSAPHGVECFETTDNHLSKTHSGLTKCSDRLWRAVEAKVGALLAVPGRTQPLIISLVGHSFGGLMCRSVATRLHASPWFVQKRIELQTLVCLASPHLGCRRLGLGGSGGVAPLMVHLGPSIMRAGLRLIKGRTGPDLLLDNDALVRLADAAHCAALAAFRRRLLYCNGTGDWTVNFESASLLTLEEIRSVLPPSVAACRAEDSAGVLWRPTAGEAKALAGEAALRCGGDEIPLGARESCGSEIRGAESGGGKEGSAAAPACRPQPASQHVPAERTLVLHPLPPSWSSEATARAHRTWDDRGGRRAEKATGLLRQLRGVGEWRLHICHFGSRASFAGGVFSPHIDIIDRTRRLEQPASSEACAPSVPSLGILSFTLPSRGIRRMST